MPTPILPTVPTDLICGNLVSSSDMNELAACCTFLLSKPICHVSNNGSQTISSTSGPGTAVNWAIESATQDYDPEGMYSAGNPGRLTIQTPGFYKVRYSVGGGSSTAVINAAVWGTGGPNNPLENGSVIGGAGYWGSFSSTFAGTNAAGSSGLFPYYLYVGDYLQVLAYGSASWGTGGLTNTTWMSLEWVSS